MEFHGIPCDLECANSDDTSIIYDETENYCHNSFQLHHIYNIYTYHNVFITVVYSWTNNPIDVFEFNENPLRFYAYKIKYIS